jgi:transcription-repair coupling factor (superfamily II helicase)
MKDLEIRGAGTLLGTKQSGYISAIGFNLYCRLLAEAVEDQKAKLAGVREKKPPVLSAPSIDLPLTAYIPDDYVSDIETRLSLYQRMVKLEMVEDVAALAQELEDRFGDPPDEVRNLLYAIKIKLLGAKAKLESVSTEDGQIVLRVFQGMQFDRTKLAPLLKEGIRIGVTQLRLPVRKGWQGLLEEVLLKVPQECRMSL